MPGPNGGEREGACDIHLADACRADDEDPLARLHPVSRRIYEGSDAVKGADGRVSSRWFSYATGLRPQDQGCSAPDRVTDHLFGRGGPWWSCGGAAQSSHRPSERPRHWRARPVRSLRSMQRRVCPAAGRVSPLLHSIKENRESGYARQSPLADWLRALTT